MSINKIDFFFDHYNETYFFMDKPLIEIVFIDDITDLTDFLEKLDEDKVYVIMAEWIPDFTKDSDDYFIFLGQPFLVTKNSNPWVIHIKNEINKAKVDFNIKEDNKLNICLVRFNIIK